MTQTTKAKPEDKDVIARLADAGEDVVKRLGEMPGGQRLIDAAQGLRERLDEVQRRLRSLDPLEKRVTELEKRLASLERKAKHTAAKPQD